MERGRRLDADLYAFCCQQTAALLPGRKEGASSVHCIGYRVCSQPVLTRKEKAAVLVPWIWLWASIRLPRNWCIFFAYWPQNGEGGSYVSLKPFNEFVLNVDARRKETTGKTAWLVASQEGLSSMKLEVSCVMLLTVEIGNNLDEVVYSGIVILYVAQELLGRARRAHG
jgi:hypothetical protein